MEVLLIKAFLPTAIAFIFGMSITPLVTHYLYHFKLWKKKSGKGNGYGGGGTPIFDKLHKEKDTNTPRMGGVIIWISVLLTLVFFAIFEILFPESFFGSLSFFSREQTWLPLMAMMVGATVGFIDDLLVVSGTGKHFAGGLPLTQRMAVVGVTAVFCGWWFYEKLGVTSVSFFGFTNIELGIYFIPFFTFVAVCVYMSSVIDGLDGLAGGVFLFIFTAYTGIAFYQAQYDIAALCATVVGGILSFLWFNIPPARFYMTETGIMALTMMLTVIAFMTDVLGEGEGVSVLPIIASMLVATVGANTIQILSKKIFKKKVFIVAPLHHHFEAIGWPAYKITMRYWILGLISAILGMLMTIAL